MTLPVDTALRAARRAVQCLYLEVPALVADDVREKVEAAFAALASVPARSPDDLTEARERVHLDALSPSGFKDYGVAQARLRAVAIAAQTMLDLFDRANAFGAIQYAGTVPAIGIPQLRAALARSAGNGDEQ